MAPKVVKSKPITSFFLKPSANLPRVESRKDVDDTIEDERRFTSLVAQVLESSSSSTGISVPSKKRRLDLDVPEFGVAPIQVKKSTKVGNFTLTSIEDTLLPVLSVRARDRSQKLLSSAKNRNSAKEINIEEMLSTVVETPTELEPAVNICSASVIDDDFVQSTAVKTSNKKGTITETESQREIYLHIAEGDSNEGS